jgi:DNA polymerase III epsilon subunit-like protein
VKRFIIDIEASGLGPESYPIEVAIVDLDSDFYFVALIKPDQDWLGDEWDDIAEGVHNISRETLELNGRPADLVAKELWGLVASAKLYSDAPEMDGFWLDRLRRTAWPELPSLVVRPAWVDGISGGTRRHRALEDARSAKVQINKRNVL